jgi:hypothetical protein
MLKYKIYGNNTKIQTNDYLKYFFLDLFDAKVSKMKVFYISHFQLT